MLQTSEMSIKLHYLIKYSADNRKVQMHRILLAIGLGPNPLGELKRSSQTLIQRMLQLRRAREGSWGGGVKFTFAPGRPSPSRHHWYEQRSVISLSSITITHFGFDCCRSKFDWTSCSRSLRGMGLQTDQVLVRQVPASGVECYMIYLIPITGASDNSPAPDQNRHRKVLHNHWFPGTGWPDCTCWCYRNPVSL